MPIDQETRRALAARVQYYRDLGITDFYRRTPRELPETFQSNAAVEAPTSKLPILGKTVPTDKVSALREIRDDIGDCTRCRLHKGRTNLVFGVGNPDTELMFVGEGPGADEDAQGEPFVGRAGQLLNNMIAAMGLRR